MSLKGVVNDWTTSWWQTPIEKEDVTPKKNEGGQLELWVADEDVKSLLGRVLKELKLMNTQLSILTDNELNGVD